MGCRGARERETGAGGLEQELTQFRQLADEIDLLTERRVARAHCLDEGRTMRESSTYQAVLDEGRAEGRIEGAKQILLRLASARLGTPDRRTREAIDALTSMEQVEALTERLLVATSWDELLAEP